MPVMEARRKGPCSACQGEILPGTLIDYTRVTGPRHLTCTDQPVEERPNRHTKPCAICLHPLAPAEGTLHAWEREKSPGVWERGWFARCRDVEGCNARVGTKPKALEVLGWTKR